MIQEEINVNNFDKSLINICYNYTFIDYTIGWNAGTIYTKLNQIQRYNYSYINGFAIFINLLEDACMYKKNSICKNINNKYDILIKPINYNRDDIYIIIKEYEKFSSFYTFLGNQFDNLFMYQEKISVYYNDQHKYFYNKYKIDKFNIKFELLINDKILNEYDFELYEITNLVSDNRIYQITKYLFNANICINKKIKNIDVINFFDTFPSIQSFCDYKE